jgi:lipopolysaccharide transport system permease protein
LRAASGEPQLGLVGTHRPEPARTLPAALGNVWRYRDLLTVLTVRQIKIKFQHSALGIVWALAGPAITIGILFVVFTNFVRLPIEHYWAFLLAGYFVFHSISQSLSHAATAPFEYATMYQNAAFPAEVPILAQIASRFVEFLAALVLVLVLIVPLHHGHLPAALLLLPVLILAHILLIVGLALPVALLSLFSFDFRNVLPLVLMSLFYLTPVFYSIGFVPERLRPLLYLNPLTSLIECYQTVLYGGTAPGVLQLGLAISYALIVFVIGYVIFNRVRTVFAEVA